MVRKKSKRKIGVNKRIQEKKISGEKTFEIRNGILQFREKQ
jgi:hypothetical protein